MATLSIKEIKPRDTISTRAVTKAVRDAIHHIFSNCTAGVWLVGGTALAGFYAEHRRSDDIDLFAASASDHRAAVFAVKSLQKTGAIFSREMQTPQFYRTDVAWHGHKFTIDIVLDENIHRIGKAIHSKDGVTVADLDTLYSMKAACLVSRCSEKDLFDLDWMFSKIGEPDIADFIKRGSSIDGGLTAETLLYSIKGALIRKEACHFLLANSKITVEEVYKRILSLQKNLTALLLEYEKTAPLPSDVIALSKTVRSMKKIK